MDFVLKAFRFSLLVTLGVKYGYSFELVKKITMSLCGVKLIDSVRAVALSFLDFGRPPRELKGLLLTPLSLPSSPKFLLLRPFCTAAN